MLESPLLLLQKKATIPTAHPSSTTHLCPASSLPRPTSTQWVSLTRGASHVAALRACSASLAAHAHAFYNWLRPICVFEGDPAHGFSAVMNFTTPGAKPLRIGIFGDLGEADFAVR